MTEELLRRWVRGELPPAERREVSRWIVRCTSPELGPLMHGMAVEQRDQERDATLSARGDWWQRLLDRWNDLLEAGHAHVTFGDDAGLVLASLAAGAMPVSPLAIVDEPGGARATFVLTPPPSAPTELAMYFTDDTGGVVRLVAPVMIAGPMSVPLPTASARATVWAVCAAVLPRESDVSVEFDRAADAPGAQVWAARLSPV